MAQIYQQSKRTVLTGIIFFVILFAILIGIFIFGNNTDQIKSEVLLAQIQILEKKIKMLESKKGKQADLEIIKNDNNELFFNCHKNVLVEVKMHNQACSFALKKGTTKIKLSKSSQNKLFIQNLNKNDDIYVFELLNDEIKDVSSLEVQFELILPSEISLNFTDSKNHELLLGYVNIKNKAGNKIDFCYFLKACFSEVK